MPETHTPEQREASSLDKWLATEFRAEYDRQAKILNKLGLLEILPECGEIGIMGIDGMEILKQVQDDGVCDRSVDPSLGSG